MIFKDNTTILQDTIQSPGFSIGWTTPQPSALIQTIDLPTQLYGVPQDTLDANIALRNVNAYLLANPNQTTWLVFSNSPYSVVATDTVLLINATAGNIVVNLPSAVGLNGRQFTFKKIDATANTITITPVWIETIDWSATLVLSAANAFTVLVSNNINYYVI